MVGRRTSARFTTLMQEADDFVPAENFDFASQIKSPKGAMTRSRRSSVLLKKPPKLVDKPAAGRKPARRQSMLPSVAEEKKKPATTSAARKQAPAKGTATKLPVSKKPAAAAPTKKAAPAPKTTTGISTGSFYSPSKPAVVNGKKKAAVAPAVAPSPVKKSLMLMAKSPSKQISKRSFLSESDISKNLEDMFDKTPENGERPPKTFETEAPERVKPRRTVVYIKSPLVKVTAGAQSKKTEPKAKSPVADAQTPVANKRRSVAKSAKKTPAAKPRGKMTPIVNISKLVHPMSEKKKTPAKAAATPGSSKSVKKSHKAAPQIGTKRKLENTDSSINSPKIEVKKLRVESPRPAAGTSSAVVTPPRSSTKTPPASQRKILTAKRTNGARSVGLRAAGRGSPAPRALQKLKAPAGTPAQVNPGNLLKRNLKKQVDRAIDSKLMQKPNSSPYLLEQKDENSSPKFVKVHSPSPSRVKAHITGTPAAVRSTAGAGRRRKFGTVFQPSQLALTSPTPGPVRRPTSTPLTAANSKRGAAGELEETPITRAPAVPKRVSTSPKAMPSSPAKVTPELMTGRLVDVCAIM